MKRRNTPAKNEILKMFKSADTALSQDMIEQKIDQLENPPEQDVQAPAATFA